MNEETNPAPEAVETSAPEMSYEESMARTHLETNPQDIPAQYGGDVEKFMESMREQRAALTRTQQELAELKKEQVAPVETPAPEAQSTEAPDSLAIPEPEAPAEVADIWGDLETEFVQSGDLSAETRAALAERGIPANVVDNYLAGVQAQQAQAAQKAAERVGGPDKLNSIIEWAGKNLTPEEREATNAALQTPGWETTLLGLQARMVSSSPTANEIAPGPVTQATNSPSVVPYANQIEMASAIQDPRYGVEPQYTEFVQNRIRMTGGGR